MFPGIGFHGIYAIVVPSTIPAQLCDYEYNAFALNRVEGFVLCRGIEFVVQVVSRNAVSDAVMYVHSKFIQVCRLARLVAA